MNAKTWSLSATLLIAALAGAQSEAGRNDTASTNSGPVRLARISYAEGSVSWRPDDGSAWSQATPNLPLQQGAQVWVTGRGRAEIQFDDGSDLRVGNDAVVTLQSLYSDSQGEFTEIKLNDGTSSLHLKDKYSIYQLDTPFESVKAAGPARFRVDVGDQVSVGVRTGAATITAAGGDTELRSGDFVSLRSAQDRIRVQSLPREDAWDRFDDERDGAASGGIEHLPPNIAIVAGGLDNYGSWRLEGRYGWVWRPAVGASWRPYHDGHWVWVNPFGWTWCSDEAWGWAPYHYGSWAHFGWGWGWCPGPYNQYWCPAAVSFTLYNGNYCWTPLCPDEVFYPDFLSVGFGSGNWWFNFSIGGCAVYRPWRHDAFVFGRRDFDRHNWNDRFAEVGRFGVGNQHFVPRNAAWGAVSASEHGFGQGGRFGTIRGNANKYFARGRSVTAASHAFSGPVTAQASRASMTPTHTFNSSARPLALNRALYRAPVSANIARTSQPFGRTISSGRSTRSVGRTGSNMPRGTASSAVARARQSLRYSGRGTRNGGSSTGGSPSGRSSYGRDSGRSSSSSSGSGRGNPRPMTAVERARQSLGYLGRSNSGSSGNRPASGGSNRGTYGGRSSGSAGSGGYSGPRGGSSNSGSRGVPSGSRGYSGYRGGSSNSGSRGVPSGSRGYSGYRGGG
ncbi:MAG: DUF6600 domain-containing protein, partial [Fimbriimonadaceae bacterium]